MLVFGVACGASPDVSGRVAEAVGRFAEVVPNLDRSQVVARASESGLTVVAMVSHSAAVAAPRRYVVHADDMLAFDGLPLDPDGRLVLDAEQLLGVSELDGAGTGLRISFPLDQVELITGTLGLTPSYVAAAPGGGHVVSNSAHALRWLLDLNEPDPLGLSSFLTLGWAVSDTTLTKGISVLPGGSRIRIDRSAIRIDEAFGSHQLERQLARSAGYQSKVLAEQMTATTAGLSAFGSEVRCALTAGRDSRVCLGLLRAAGIDASYYTFGTPGDADVDHAVELARRFGLEHEVVPASVLVRADSRRLARTFVLQNDGLRSFEQIVDQVDADAPIASLGVKVSGAVGEIARTGTTPVNALATNLRPLADSPAFQRRLLGSKLDASEGFASPLSLALTRDYIDSFIAVRRAEGWRTRNASGSFYLLERVRRWGATGVRQAAPSADLFSPFSSRRFIEPALACSAGRLYAECLHYDLLTALGTDLRDFPFQYPWRAQSSHFVGPRALGMAGREVTRRMRKSGRSPVGVRAAPGISASEWVAANAEMHLSVVERGNEALNEYVDLACLRRALETRARLGRGGLRALSAVWWFDTSSGEADAG